MPSTHSPSTDDIVEFLRHRPFKYVKQLGHGACGKTVLLRDDEIDEQVVCKKFHPTQGDQEELFQRFRQEIKILHKLFHPNVVRVYDYFLYPKDHAGFIVMEFIEGLAIDKFLNQSPDKLESIFLQLVRGFRHLASHKVLHRDIRCENILVQVSGRLKIIDLGFGKVIHNHSDFAKSISLNWEYAPPLEFNEQKYDFSTDVYFVGKLFDGILGGIDGDSFKYKELVSQMCQKDPAQRISSFSVVIDEIRKHDSLENGFDISEEDQCTYRQFSDAFFERIQLIERSAKYRTNCQDVQSRLDALLEKTILESYVLIDLVADCLIEGHYCYCGQDRFEKNRFPVTILHEFVSLFKSCGKALQRVILLNLQTRINSIKRFDISSDSDTDDDIPF